MVTVAVPTSHRSPRRGLPLKNAEERMDVIAAYRDVGSYRGAAAICHEHGTAVGGFLPASWDHLFCQSWDHPARRSGGLRMRSLTAHVMTVDVEVSASGIQGGQRGRSA